ncbi:hypothetical protein GCM10010464_74560 [Pseudonocardia yunnanensis]|uniref:Uncharacterized protein n=1 Tax=Pseudonocardia yunnanensis TaxID=58107 RepID=A0ABW4F5G2_9PSEU
MSEPTKSETTGMVSQKGLMVVQEGMLSANGRDGVVEKRSPLPALWMALVVERACTEIWRAWEEKNDVTELHVNPAVYEAVALARPGEVGRGYPLMLLGLELIPDKSVQVYEPVVIRS